jgi:threonine/homoserine/homoserine lactone efflux protein
MFLAGWALALAVISSVAYYISDAADAATISNASDGVSWSKILFGVIFLLLAARSWRNRPAPGAAPEMPKWMAGIDSFSPGKAFGLAVLLAGVNPKNLLLAAGAGSALAQLGLSTTDAVVSHVVFVVLGSLTIVGPVVYYLVGDKAKAELDSMKGWLAAHNAAVMTVLFLVFGVDLIAKGIPPLT